MWANYLLFFMKRFLIPLLAAIALPTAVSAEVTNDSIFNAKQADYFFKSKQAKKLLSGGKFSEAETICDELIEISPDNPNSYICKGIALGFASENKKKIKAKRYFTKAIKIDPEYNEAYFFRGLLQFTMRRREGSGTARNSCKDMSRAYFNNYPPALEYVKKNKSFVKSQCYQFYKE